MPASELQFCCKIWKRSAGAINRTACDLKGTMMHIVCIPYYVFRYVCILYYVYFMYTVCKCMCVYYMYSVLLHQLCMIIYRHRPPQWCANSDICCHRSSVMFLLWYLLAQAPSDVPALISVVTGPQWCANSDICCHRPPVIWCWTSAPAPPTVPGEALPYDTVHVPNPYPCQSVPCIPLVDRCVDVVVARVYPLVVRRCLSLKEYEQWAEVKSWLTLHCVL